MRTMYHIFLFIIIKSVRQTHIPVSTLLHIIDLKLKLSYTHYMRNIRWPTNVTWCWMLKKKKSSPTNVHFTLFKYNRAFCLFFVFFLKLVSVIKLSPDNSHLAIMQIHHSIGCEDETIYSLQCNSTCLQCFELYL